jgi:hypothetical protein
MNCYAGFVAQSVEAVIPECVFTMQEFRLISQSALRALCGLSPAEFKWLDPVAPKPSLPSSPKDERKIMTSRPDEVMRKPRLIPQRNFGKRIISSRP